jgi:hypothetical protein
VLLTSGNAPTRHYEECNDTLLLLNNFAEMMERVDIGAENVRELPTVEER